MLNQIKNAFPQKGIRRNALDFAEQQHRVMRHNHIRTNALCFLHNRINHIQCHQNFFHLSLRITDGKPRLIPVLRQLFRCDFLHHTHDILYPYSFYRHSNASLIKASFFSTSGRRFCAFSVGFFLRFSSKRLYFPSSCRSTSFKIGSFFSNSLLP